MPLKYNAYSRILREQHFAIDERSMAHRNRPDHATMFYRFNEREQRMVFFRTYARQYELCLLNRINNKNTNKQ